MRNHRQLDRHFENSGQPGFSAITEYKDNRTGKIVRAPSSSYTPKDSERWSKVEPTPSYGGPAPQPGGPIHQGGGANFRIFGDGANQFSM